MNILYLCDGNRPCFKEYGCGYSDDPEARMCWHTKEPECARNGACEHPETEPERFEFRGGDKQFSYFVERIEYRDD